MGAKHISKNKNKDNLSNANFKNIKSNYMLSKIYANPDQKKKLKVVKYNKKIQNRLNLNIKDYEECLKIEIEIITFNYKFGKFINIEEKEKIYYHIYFKDNKEEIRNKYSIKKEDNVERIKIIIDYEVKSFEGMFKDCYCIKSINFKRFYRSNINNMSSMFSGCSSLKEINLSNFNTNNVVTMEEMFSMCESLKELNLSNFKTLNTKNTKKMFFHCKSLIKLNLANFNFDNIIFIDSKFKLCSFNLVMKIKRKFKGIKEKAFE